MQVHRVGASLRISRITGPTHNFLGLQFGPDAPPVGVKIFDLNDGPVGRLSGDEVRRFALQGVEEANRVRGTRLHVVAVEYLSTDSPPESTYRMLAELIAREA